MVALRCVGLSFFGVGSAFSVFVSSPRTALPDRVGALTRRGHCATYLADSLGYACFALSSDRAPQPALRVPEQHGPFHPFLSIRASVELFRFSLATPFRGDE